MVLDVNVLLALFRTDHPRHQVVLQWWGSALEDGTTMTAPDTVWAGVVRLATSPRVFDPPASPAEVFAFLRAVHDQPTYLPIGPLPDVLTQFERVCVDSDARADLAPDAYIAAVARCLGATVVTFDRDFRRFADVRLVELG